MFQAILFKVVERMRPRTDHAHLSPQHIPQLRKLIQTVAPQKLAYARYARIGGDLETRPLTLVLHTQAVLQSVRIGNHSAKFVANKLSPLEPYSLGLVDNQSGGSQLDDQRDRHHQ